MAILTLLPHLTDTMSADDKERHFLTCRIGMWRVTPSANPGPTSYFARANVTQTYPDPLFASNAAGRSLSMFGALSQMTSVSPLRA